MDVDAKGFTLVDCISKYVCMSLFISMTMLDNVDGELSADKICWWSEADWPMSAGQ
jgi:hypothetical protein